VTGVEFQSVSKSYAIYYAPEDRPKELVTLNRSKRHRDFRALRDVSFEVGHGETFCIIGENGSGKSTVLEIVAGILPPTAGTVVVCGRVAAQFVSHSASDVEAAGDRGLWLDHGRVAGLGEPNRVGADYQAAMAEKDSSYRRRHLELGEAGITGAAETADRIPNIDHRSGDGRAEVVGIAVLNEHGRPLEMLEPGSRILIRISVRANQDVGQPIVGFLLRNQLGLHFSGTNTARVGCSLPPLKAGSVLTVDFSCDLPELYAGSFSFSPMVFDGTLCDSSTCDWIDNAIALQMGRSASEVYGYLHLPCRVEVNARMRQEPAEVGRLVEKPNA
jgi:hypothetical protein